MTAPVDPRALQARFDTEAAHLAVVRYRIPPRPSGCGAERRSRATSKVSSYWLRRLPLFFALVAMAWALLATFAVLTP